MRKKRVVKAWVSVRNKNPKKVVGVYLIDVTEYLSDGFSCLPCEITYSVPVKGGRK